MVLLQYLCVFKIEYVREPMKQRMGLSVFIRSIDSEQMT